MPAQIMHPITGVVVAVIVGGWLCLLSQTKAANEKMLSPQAVMLAVSEDRAVAGQAIAELRSMGPGGLALLLNAHADDVKQYTELSSTGAGPASKRAGIDRLRSAVDSVAAQRDAIFSRLYWFTDWPSAAAEAKRTNRPILTLRMLGKLSDDRSCANSRFFRTILYANSDVSGYLREHFVLHWESVRPVPHITIDFGDGRKIERTITGNSIHYIATPEGIVVDTLPGVYAPRAFRSRLEAAFATATHRDQPDTPIPANPFVIYTRYRRSAVADLDQRLHADLSVIGIAQPPAQRLDVLQNVAASKGSPTPTGREAAVRTVSKTRAERPLLDAVTATPRGGAPDSSGFDEETWAKLALLHRGGAALDASSRTLIRTKSGDAAVRAGRLSTSKAVFEDPMLKVFLRFEGDIARDTVFNEYRLRRELLGWLVADPALASDLRKLNDRVYAELFLTPLNDPWMGLAPDDVYAALDGAGLVQPPDPARQQAN